MIENLLRGLWSSIVNFKDVILSGAD